MEKPQSPSALAKKAGISVPYASQILSGERAPARPLAIRIFRATGWKPSPIKDLSEEDIATLERLDRVA